MTARTVASGRQVLPAAARMAALMQPVSAGTSLGQAYRIEPGTLDRQQGLMILGQASNETFYIQNDTLSALPTPAFLQGYMIGQVAAEAYRRTQWIVPVARTSMALCMGIATGAAGAVGVAANIAVLLARWLAFVDGHPQDFGIVRQHLPATIRGLMWFRSHCPVLFGKLRSLLRGGVVQAMEQAPAGITPEDVAAVTGRLLGGVVGASDTGLAVLAGVFARTLAVYGALHLPLMALRGAGQDMTSLALSLVDVLRRQRASITPAEERQIIRELSQSAEVLTQLRATSTSLAALAPALDRLVAESRRP